MAIKIIDDTILQDIAVSIQEKDHGGKMEVTEMASRVEALPVDQIDSLLNGTIERVNIPTATSIPNNFFMYINSLIYCDSPNVTSIGANAFYDCQNLETVIFSSNTTIILDSVFYHCYKLNLDYLPDGITKIGAYAFHSCSFLGITKLPSSLISIGNQSFFGCIGIPYLDLSDLQQIPTLGSKSFNSTTFPFLFRDQTQLDEYATATNWSALASRFQIKPSGVI